jgi:hypothetical protein
MNGTLPIDRLLATKAAEIIGEVAKEHGHRITELTSRCRRPALVCARQEAALRLHKFGFSPQEISGYLCRERSTIAYHLGKAYSARGSAQT